MKSYPTVWQKQTMWGTLTAISVVSLGALTVFLIWITAQVLSFLQPLLIPFAVAGVLAYLLEPLVRKLCSLGLSRMRAVLVVFGIFFISAALLLLWMTPLIYHQSIEFGQEIPGYVEKGRAMALAIAEKYQERFADSPYVQEATVWLQQQLPGYVQKTWQFIGRSIGGFLGVFGFILGMIVIPLYLFFFLKESDRISAHWSDYLPLQASHFKDEVVATLEEINGYLIAFFRGQLVVSIIDGIFIGLGLFALGLKFGILIGLFVCILAIIPYLGTLICWVPAVIIAAVQWGDWAHPLMVTGIFILVNQLEGWLLAPKIVGDSVGLHPLTVIASVIGWSLLLGGLLGAILAIPLTATLKVLLRRYVWQRRYSSEQIVQVHETSPLYIPEK
jgi:predicted PurR-regulated permease PerM